MKAQLARWGNSLGVRIPKAFADRLGLVEGSRVEIEAADDQIVITSLRPRYRLNDLLSGVTPEAMRDAFNWGPDAGREDIPE